MIRCTWYFWNGRESHAHDCETIEAAFERLQRTGMDANVWPIGTRDGLYVWGRDKEHTLEAFRAKMEHIIERNKPRIMSNAE